MGSIISGILSFLGAPLLANLVEAYKAKLASVNSTDQKALDLAIKDLETQIEARKQAVILAGNRGAGIVQIMFALPVVIYNAKVILWDKVFALGSTDPITGAVGTWVGLIIGFYFGGQIVSGVVNTVARRLGK